MSTWNPPQAECLSPTGLSMHQWTDAYINVLLRSVAIDMGLQMTQTSKHAQIDVKIRPEVQQSHVVVKTRTSADREAKKDQISHADRAQQGRVTSANLEENLVSRYVEGVISQSMSIVQSQEAEFIHDLVWGALHCASRDIMQDKDFQAGEHSLDLFNREFVKEELESALADVKAEVSGSERTGLSYLGPDKTSCIRSRSSHGQSKPKSGIKVKKVIKPNEKTGFDFMYVRNRLRAIFGRDADRAVVRYVLSNVPARGSWSEQFKAVDEAIQRVVREHKSGQPLVTEFHDPALAEKKSTTGKGDVSVIGKFTESATPTELSQTKTTPTSLPQGSATTETAAASTQKMMSTPSFSRTRRFINRVRKSLFIFGSKK